MRGLFRYPGGKARLASKIAGRFTEPRLYAEPMVGGGAVAIQVAHRNPRTKIVVGDIQPDIASFWGLMADDRIEDLCDVLRPLTLDFYAEAEAYRGSSVVLRARRAVVVNKGGFNGYLRPGTVPVGGWNQAGKWKVDWAWRLPHIRKQLRGLQKLLAGRLVAEHQSIFESRWVQEADAAYLDPPYINEGPRMYGAFGDFDHGALAELCAQLRAQWLLTYAEHDAIHDFYRGCRMESLVVRGGRHTLKSELLIGPSAVAEVRRLLRTRATEIKIELRTINKMLAASR